MVLSFPSLVFRVHGSWCRSRLSGEECELPRRLELESIAAVGLIALKAMKQSITVVDRMLFVMFVDWFGEYAENDYEVHAPPPPAPRKLSELECDSNFCIRYIALGARCTISASFFASRSARKVLFSERSKS